MKKDYKCEDMQQDSAAFFLWDLEISDIANDVGCWDEGNSSFKFIPMLAIKNFQFVVPEIKLDCHPSSASLNDD